MTTLMTRTRDAREAAMLASIARYWEQNGYGPTVRELQDELGLSSLSVVSHWLQRLESRGRIVRTRGIARSIRVTGGQMSEERPVYDGAASGQASAEERAFVAGYIAATHHPEDHPPGVVERWGRAAFRAWRRGEEWDGTVDNDAPGNPWDPWTEAVAIAGPS